jgi:aldehyde dehydrogenase (NAD+)
MTKPITTAKNTAPKEIQRIFALQQAHQYEVARTSARERIAKLKKLEQLLLKYQDDIREAVYADFQKPEVEADMVEIYPVKSEIKYTIKNLRRWMAPQRVGTPLTLLGSRSHILYEPKGVVLIIAPWNYPVNLMLGPLVTAIAAGNCVMLKPSEVSAHTSAVLTKMIGEGFDEREIAMVEGAKETAEALLDQPFNHIYFTGSPQIGKIVMRAAAKHLASVTLELGGKSPTIVDESANLKQAAKRIAWAKFTNAGQTCIAPDYLFVHHKVKDDLLKYLQQALHSFFGENAQVSDSFARMSSSRHFERVKGYLEDAAAKGAKVVSGGTSDAEERYIEPTLLTDVDVDSEVMEHEIFGPVFPVLTFEKIEETVDFINQRERPLALYIYSQNNKNIHYVLNNTRSGGVGINQSVLHYMNHELPFGGVNNSGIGKGHGWFGFEAFSNAKSVLRQDGWSIGEMAFPPYNDFKRRMADFLLKWF